MDRVVPDGVPNKAGNEPLSVSSAFVRKSNSARKDWGVPLIKNAAHRS